MDQVIISISTPPRTHNGFWRQKMGDLVQRLYLQKLRDDGNYEVLSFSSNIILKNMQRRDLVYFIRKEETFSTPIRKLTVNGQPCAYTSSEHEILFTVPVPAGESRHVIIEYENDLELEAIDLAKHDIRINLLRRFSDFRDLFLAKNAWAQKAIRFYYRTNLYHSGLILPVLLLVAAIIAARSGWVLFKRMKKTPSTQTTQIIVPKSEFGKSLTGQSHFSKP